MKETMPCTVERPLPSSAEAIMPRISESALRVTRRDIDFRNIATDVVRIAITVHNDDQLPSQPTTMEVSAAPLGAFLPWRRIGTLDVPPIPPNSSTVVEMLARRPMPTRADGFAPLDAVSPLVPQVSTARPPTDRGNLATLPMLPADPFDSRRYRTPHWAGNINVFIGKRPVERHQAVQLRIHPGCINYALFFIGKLDDEYRLDLELGDATWEVELFADHPAADEHLALGQWHSGWRVHMVTARIAPPQITPVGSIAIKVMQRSTGSTAMVEFSFDPHAKGPGCYVLDADGAGGRPGKEHTLSTPKADPSLTASPASSGSIVAPRRGSLATLFRRLVGLS